MLAGRKPLMTCAYMGGVPAVLEKFCWAWSQMILFTQEAICTDLQYIHIDRATSSDHAPARNSLAERFMGDYLFMTDTDHEFAPDLVVRLFRHMQAANIDVLTGRYHFKSEPYCPLLFSWTQEFGATPIINWSKDAHLVQIGSAGGGCLLVKRKVFQTIEDELHEGPFDRTYPLSEDHSFFRRCKNLGIKVYAAPKIESGHLRVLPVTLSDFHPETMMVSEPIPVGGFK